MSLVIKADFFYQRTFVENSKYKIDIATHFTITLFNTPTLSYVYLKVYFIIQHAAHFVLSPIEEMYSGILLISLPPYEMIFLH